MNFWRYLEDHPDDIALMDAVSGARTTFNELAERSHQSAHALRALGLETGDTAAVMLSNRSEMIELFLAATEIGLYFLPINHRLLAKDVAHYLSDSGSKALITESLFAQHCAEGARLAGLAEQSLLSVDSAAGTAAWPVLRDQQPTSPPGDRSAGRYLGYTSGTTGKPKGVRHPLPGTSPDDVAYPDAFGLDPTPGPDLVACPLYHTGPLMAATMRLHNGNPLVLMGKWTPESHLEAIQRYGVVTTTMVPTQFVRLLKLPVESREAYDLSTVEVVAHMGAPCPIEVKKQMISWLGPVLYESYGGTEGFGLIVDSEEWLARPGTLGRRTIGTSEVFVLDEEGHPAAPHELGRIFIRTGTGWEYLNDPSKTAEAYLGDMFTVGDLGHQDEEGFFFLMTRRSDLIISGGVNIYPAQIEGTLVLHPAVNDVAVFGIPNEEWGQEVKAVVELVPEANSVDALVDIHAYAEQELPSHMRPRSIDVTEALPRNPNGKLYKRELSDPYWRKEG